MAHIIIILFFGLVFGGTGVAAQLLMRDYRAEIAAALRGEMPVRRTADKVRFKVTLRPAPACARLRPGVAA